MESQVATSVTQSIFSNRNFSLLCGGSSISSLGDQFTLVALPWLVLKLTGDPAALGLVLASIALPRALFMLIGGAVVDRMSPRRVLLAARTVNALLIATLAVLVLGGNVNMPAVYSIALGTGLATAFAYPAGTSLLPQVVTTQQLATGNALFMASRQASLFVGPALAGLVIGTGAASYPGDGSSEVHRLGLAFSIDAVSFLFSLASLGLVRIRDEDRRRSQQHGVLASLVEGVRAAWSDPPVRAFLLYATAAAMLVGGPIQVGLPVLANTRLDLGAASLGLLMTANGGGMLVGAILTPFAGGRLQRQLGSMMLVFDALMGIALAYLAWIHTTATGAVLLAATGILGGIAQTSIMTWVQQRVPQAQLGRVMSLLLFIFMGLGPISAVVAGGLLKWISLPTLFSGAGLMLTAIALACMASPALRAIGIKRPALE